VENNNAKIESVKLTQIRQLVTYLKNYANKNKNKNNVKLTPSSQWRLLNLLRPQPK